MMHWVHNVIVAARARRLAFNVAIDRIQKKALINGQGVSVQSLSNIIKAFVFLARF